MASRMGSEAPLGLFEGHGIELEYMIVDERTLDVAPIADLLIRAESGQVDEEVERGRFAWSNELARHVIEVKTNGPVASLTGLAEGFQAELRRMEEHLAPLGARLLPTAMHPWMDAAREFEIWPHGSREIYEAFDRIFDCRGHGWANLQSAHLNLPFADDGELARLHGAARALLPLMPALAASSPCLEGRISGYADTRLDVYATNARKVPSVSGSVVPEPITTRADSESLLASIYADLAPFDPAGILRHEWVNARGCIVRFDRMAVEIRLLDVQECPQADVAIAAAVTGCLKALCEPDLARQERLRALETPRLARLLRATIRDGERAWIDDADYLIALGQDERPRQAAELWSTLIDRDVRSQTEDTRLRSALDVLCSEGPLSSRILRRLRTVTPAGREPSRDALECVWRELADCLREGRMFRAEA